MVFFEYDAEAEKGSPSWTALQTVDKAPSCEGAFLVS